MSTGTQPSIFRCTYQRAWRDTFAMLYVRTTNTTTTTTTTTTTRLGQVCELFFFQCVASEWMSLAGDPPQGESRGVDGSGGCVRGGDTNSRPSAWLWPLRRTTARSRTPHHGDRRPAPEPGRWRSKVRTSAYGHRRLFHGGRGLAS